MKQVSEEAVRMELVKITSGSGAARRWAREMNLSETHISAVKNKKVRLGEKIATALGFKVGRELTPRKPGPGRCVFYVDGE